MSLLRIFRANNGYNFILLPIFGALLLMKTFLDTKGINAGNIVFTSPITGTLDLSGMSHLGVIILAYIPAIIISFLLLSINARFSFIRERSFLPSYLFIILAFTQPSLHFIHPVYVSGIFILLAISVIFSAYEEKKAISKAFNAGVLTGLAGLFYLSSSLYIILVPISLFALRGKIGWREYFTSFIGFLIPWIYTFSSYFIFGDISKLIDILAHSVSYNKPTGTIIEYIPEIVFFFVIFVITVIASFYILNQYDENKISTRRYNKILFFYFATSLIITILPQVSFEVFVLISIPLTYLFSNYLSFMKRRFWAEFFFAILILFSIMFQFVVEWMRQGQL